MTNLLSAVDSSFETGIGTWKALTNVTLAQDSGSHFIGAGITGLDGTKLLVARQIAAGAGTTFQNGLFPVSASTTYWLQASVWSTSTVYTASFTVTWYNSSLSVLGTATENLTLNSSIDNPNVLNASHASPSGAAFARITAAGPNFGGGAASAIGLDKVGLSTTSTWVLGTGAYSNPPNAPTLTAPANSTTIDCTATQRFAWTFSDPDPGDSQSAFDLRYSSNGGTTWTTVSGTTPNGFLDIAGGTFTSGGSYQWQVRTYDSLNTVGPWSTSSFFTAGTPSGGPTITAPTSGATIGITPATVSWSFTTQQGYQVRRVADLAGAADPTTVYYDTGQITDTVTRSVSVPFPTNNRFEHVQVRVESGGLWSAWSDVRINVSYTAPPTPAVTVTPDAVNAKILVAVTTAAGGSTTIPASLSVPTSLFTPVLPTTEAAVTSPSFTAPAGELIIITASLFTPSSAGATTFAITGTLGLTWTQVTANNGAVGNESVASIFYAVGNGATGTVTVTPSRTGASPAGMTLSGYGVTGQAGVGATGTSTGSSTVTLSAAPASTSEVIALIAAGLGSDPGQAAPTGMTALFTDRHTDTYLYDTAAYKNGSPSQSMTFGGSVVTDASVVAIEITAGTVTVTVPSAAYVDIYRSEDGGATSERVATNQPTNTTWTDWTPTSGVNYSYQAVAVASSGVTAASTWAD